MQASNGCEQQLYRFIGLACDLARELLGCILNI